MTQFPGQATTGVPTSGAELDRLMARRDELRGQLEAVTEQRNLIASQLERTGSDPALRNPPLARLKAADERIDRLAREIQSADEAIAEAKSKGVSTDGEHQIPTPLPPTPFPRFIFDGGFGTTHAPSWREQLIDSAPVTVPITLATVVLVGAAIYWRLSRSLKNQIARLQATQSGALVQLQQSLDSVAVEIERVSENQRFVTKLVGDKQPVERK